MKCESKCPDCQECCGRCHMERTMTAMKKTRKITNSMFFMAVMMFIISLIVMISAVIVAMMFFK